MGCTAGIFPLSLYRALVCSSSLRLRFSDVSILITSAHYMPVIHRICLSYRSASSFMISSQLIPFSTISTMA